MSYAIYRNKSDNRICKIHKVANKYSTEETEKLVIDFNNKKNKDSIVETNDNTLIGEILDWLEETEQLQNNWKSIIKKELLENINRSQSELNDLEHFVYHFGDEE